MLNLVLAENLIVLFLGWEGVGLCSYLLIGYWYTDLKNSAAANKAFIVNRIGDFAFLLAMFLIFKTVTGAPDRHVRLRLYDAARARTLALMTGGTGFAIVLLLFIGATGKSAQIPLFVWLPDAMAGPTPVSALIHAATMVTSGLYLLARLTALVLQAPTAMAIVADGRRADGDHGGDGRDHAERHQEGARLLDGQPAGLHVSGDRRRRVLRRHLPRDDARLL